MSENVGRDDVTLTQFVLRPETIIRHYRIVEKIGFGGMGEVYLAEDTELKRRVALKFLPALQSADPDLKARFKREAQATAALKHTNIVTIYEVNEHLGRPYFAMEHVEGSSIKDLIKNDELRTPQIIELAIQLCDALQEAHNAGVVHRDIKPGNILIDKKGASRILDFGLATIIGSEQLTQAGSTMGTVGYMSPEQVTGNNTDHRSDLFSLGVVLYEMFSGHQPFKGHSQIDISNAILRDTPEPLARYKADISPELQRIISKLLEKDLELRYQSAAGLASDLKQLRGPTDRSSGQMPARVEGRKMLVVLPFENLGPADEEYFADGITEEITSRLASVGDLGVISRTSAYQYKETKKTVEQIGADLGVDYVLEGTVRWSRKTDGPNRVRITPQLIKVSDDTHVWSERYDRTLDDIFEIQSDIAEKVFDQLNINLVHKERQVIEAKSTENIDAYQAYLRGIDYMHRPDYLSVDFLSAVQMYERAVELDPEFALAWCGLSHAHQSMYFFGYDHTEPRLLKSKEAVDRALELQPNLPYAHLTLGLYYYRAHQDYDLALKEIEIARKGAPEHHEVILAAAAIYRRQGKLDAALHGFKSGFELSPQDAGLACEIGITYFTMANYEQAEKYFDRSISMAPDQVNVYTFKSHLYLVWQGDVGKARYALRQIAQQHADQFLSEQITVEICDRKYGAAQKYILEHREELMEDQQFLAPKQLLAALVYQRQNKTEEALAAFEESRIILDALVKERSDDPRIYASLGLAYAGLGLKEEAIKFGQRAIDMMPLSRDYLMAPLRMKNLADILIMVGEHDQAIDMLKELMTLPSLVTVPALTLDPRYDVLRDNPKFKALLAV